VPAQACLWRSGTNADHYEQTTALNSSQHFSPRLHMKLDNPNFCPSVRRNSQFSLDVAFRLEHNLSESLSAASIHLLALSLPANENFSHKQPSPHPSCAQSRRIARAVAATAAANSPKHPLGSKRICRAAQKKKIKHKPSSSATALLFANARPLNTAPSRPSQTAPAPVDAPSKNPKRACKESLLSKSSWFRSPARYVSLHSVQSPTWAA
jgi:hypothetical protein